MPPAAAGPTMYEIPCSCGKTLVVTAGQAGAQITCECGNLVDVPTIRELRHMAAGSQPAPSKRPRASAPLAAQDAYTKKALVVAGILLLLGGLSLFGSLYLFQRSLQQELHPQMMKWFEMQKERMDEIPPQYLWDEWKMARDGGLGEHHALPEIVNKERAQGAWYGAYVGIGASVLGLLLLIGSALMPSRVRPRR